MTRKDEKKEIEVLDKNSKKKYEFCQWRYPCGKTPCECGEKCPYNFYRTIWVYEKTNNSICKMTYDWWY